MRRYLVLVSMILLTGCGYIPQKLPFTDPQVQELLLAMDKASAFRTGFIPVTPDSDIRLEINSRPGYERALQVYTRIRGQEVFTSHSIFFRKQAEGFTWIGEQELYNGPTKLQTVDGTIFEHLSINYFTQPFGGHATNQMEIRYSGEDPRLSIWEHLPLEVVRPILKEWGYDVEKMGAKNLP